VSHPQRAAPATAPPYTPAHPDLLAFGFLSLWILILSLPMWSGQFLAGPYSDQATDGYAIRWWSAMQWRATGHMPQWNPFLFGGHPVFTGFGDLFYPSAWLRLVLPTAIAMNVAFVVHYVLAGMFLYWLLRLLSVSWLGAVTGATAYQLSGVVVSLMSPGHDGKLFVTAMLPLMLIGLVLAMRHRRPEGHALLGLAVGLALLSPQYQMTQYALVASGVMTLYLAFGEPIGLTPRERWLGVAGAAGGVVLGFGISMIQVLPFFHSIPYGTRAESAGYAWSTSYAMPWSHVPELLFSGFTGRYETYWGPNSIKLHSEYLGLPVLALAAVGVGSSRRRLVWWLGGIALLFLLVSLGGATPFYRLWYALVPYVKKTRAPGMALYVVAFAVSTLAALGVERLERGEGKRAMQVALAAAGLTALLAGAGIFGSIAAALAGAGQHDASAAQTGITAGALGSAIGLGVLATIVLTFLRGRLQPAAFAILLVLTVGADLYRAGRGFWQWSRPEQQSFRTDPIVQHLQATPQPFRVLDTGLYPGDLLVRHQVPQVLGYSGVELGAFDDLLGGRNEWRYLRSSLHLWELLAVRFALFTDSARVPGYHFVAGPVTTATGRNGYLYEADSVPPYARVVPAAVKGDTGEVIPTLIDSRLDYNLLVVFDRFEPVNPVPLVDQHMPAPSPSHARFAQWSPGRMSVQLDPPPPAPSYLLIAENWYPDWHATVDGHQAQILRGDHAFLTVVVPTGARQVELVFASRDYARGRLITWASLVLLVAWAGAAVVVTQRARQRG
jgi:hypothetical protein